LTQSSARAHRHLDQTKLVARINRILGQLNSASSDIKEQQECRKILQTLAACRGAVDSLMVEILEGHIEHHVVPEKTKWGKKNRDATTELVDILRTYLK